VNRIPGGSGAASPNNRANTAPRTSTPVRKMGWLDSEAGSRFGDHFPLTAAKSVPLPVRFTS